MEHPNQTIANQGLTPVGNKQPTVRPDVGLAAGSVYAAFAKGQDNTKTRCLFELKGKGFTFDEFEQIEQRCIALAKEADKAMGFLAPKDAKGPEKYGPKERTMRARASERRAVFGVLALNLSAIVSVPDGGILNPDTLPAWDLALSKAKEYMRNAKINWRGESDDKLRGQRLLALERSATSEAIQEVQEANPQKQGETIAAWNTRLAELMEEAKADKLETARQEKADSIAAAIIKANGLSLALLIAEKIEAASASLQNMQAQPAGTTEGMQPQANPDAGNMPTPEKQPADMETHQ